MSLAPSPDGTEKGGGASLCWVSRFLRGKPGGTRGQSLPPDRDRREGQGSLGASAEPCCTPPPTTSCKTRPGTNCPSPRLSVSWSPPEPYHWVWVHVGAIAVPKTPKWRPGLEDNKKKIHQTRKGPRSPARRNETEEGAQGQRESARGVRAGPGGRAVGVGAPGSPTSRQRRHCWSHD